MYLQYLSVLWCHFVQKVIKVLVGEDPLILSEVVQAPHRFPQLVLDFDKSWSKRSNHVQKNEFFLLKHVILIINDLAILIERL